ncbi:hypothetical protein EJ05DRAFT_496932 [Pseudovirgaria hyperparasitica]|uniref:Uncharacterized protein n=1 Tax=Pseudovirgaria hyperparasitica TaxID=470096 RepID=A0A6A6WIY6_9PEZI|nr:uncharacterized protein EJ05DRAFT_496932 [Pseudovirgaria hyperparasitica]KAF2762060.1 hypothetical protein EJ05DRAFT_496932 [Pseudovirgaria hyperparasitica]
MAASSLEHLLCSQWDSVVCECTEQQESVDLRQVEDHKSWDAVQNQLQEMGGDQGLALLSRSLLEVQDFANICMHKASMNIDCSIIWGYMWLVLKIIHETKTGAHVLPILQDITQKIGLFTNYVAGTSALTVGMKGFCVDIGVALLQFLSHLLKFMRNNTVHTIRGHISPIEWQPLDKQYSSSCRQVHDVISCMEMLLNFARRPKPARDVGNGREINDLLAPMRRSLMWQEPAKLPCIILPSARTPKLFDRTEVTRSIEERFKSGIPEQSLQSLAIHGLGGVGKSTAALGYAETKLQQGELDAVFWVHGENESSIKQSFTDIALRLKLPDAQQGDHDGNRVMVLHWLQRTQSRWLLVFDNAEVADLIREYWPLSGRGQILITTRSSPMAYELTNNLIEVSNWNDEIGLKFLLHLLSRDIATDLEEKETASASELSERLSGHALTISAMAGLIHRHACSITEFMAFYDRYPGQVSGISANRSINAVWELSFKSLDSESRVLLGAMSFLKPDSIPQDLLEPQTTEYLDESIIFAQDKSRFSNAAENLINAALVKHDRHSRTFSIHRLVQKAFRMFLSPIERHDAFKNAATLTFKAFPDPRRGGTAGPISLYDTWDQCATYFLHVISLKDRFREEIHLNPQFTALPLYCRLNNSCQRYLLEINSLDELGDLVDVNTMALDTLPSEGRTVNLYGSLTSHHGQLLMRLGHPHEAVIWLKKSYEMRSHDVPWNPRESSAAAINVAAALATSNHFTESLRWYKLGYEHFMEWSLRQHDNKAVMSPTIRIEMGLCLYWLNDVDAARDQLSLALTHIESTTPYNWARAAGAHFGLGTVDRRERKFDTAEWHFLEAQNLWLKGDQMRTHPMYAACSYRLGCVAMEQGDITAAIKHLHDAMRQTGKSSHIMTAEHMRVLFKLAEALEQDPRSTRESISIREEAECLLRRRVPNIEDPGSEKIYDSFVCIEWR